MSLSALSLCLVSFLVCFSLLLCSLFFLVKKYPKISKNLSLRLLLCSPPLFLSLPCMLLSLCLSLFFPVCFSLCSLLFLCVLLALAFCSLLFLVCSSLSPSVPLSASLFPSAPLSLLSPSLLFFLFCLLFFPFCLLSICCFSVFFLSFFVFVACLGFGLFCCLYVHDNPWTKITLL